jgi:hypothetical protein
MPSTTLIEWPGPGPEPGFPWRYLLNPLPQKAQDKKVSKGICKHRGCTKPVRKGPKKSHECHTCHSRAYRVRNPRRYVYRQIRANAAERGIKFELTYKEFCAFDVENDYVAKRGNGPDDLTIDRIDTNGPYSADNIRALTWEENCHHLVEGFRHPWEPLAQLIALHNGSFNRFEHQGEALKLLRQVEILQDRSLPKQPTPDNEESEFFADV